MQGGDRLPGFKFKLCYLLVASSGDNHLISSCLSSLHLQNGDNSGAYSWLLFPGYRRGNRSRGIKSEASGQWKSYNSAQANLIAKLILLLSLLPRSQEEARYFLGLLECQVDSWIPLLWCQTGKKNAKVLLERCCQVSICSLALGVFYKSHLLEEFT